MKKLVQSDNLMYFCILFYLQSAGEKISCNNHTKMKTFKFYLLCMSLFLVVPLTEAQSAGVPSEIISALKAGRATERSTYLNANVELVIDNKNDVFSKQQASGIISDFFRKNRAYGFQLLHKGNKDLASFAIGMLKTSNGYFRVYVLTRKNEIQQLRIEPSND